MLAMIEINLLPQEYRPPESTNVPLMLTILGGVVVVCGLFFYMMKVQGEIEELNIGHSIVSRAVMVGMRAAVAEMRHLVKGART